MLASEAVACLEAEVEALRTENAALKAQIVAHGLTPRLTRAWPELRASPSQVAIMETLSARPDLFFNAEDLHRALLASGAAKASDPGIVKVHVCRIKKLLGEDAIETVGGRGNRSLGWRIGRPYRTKPERTEP